MIVDIIISSLINGSIYALLAIGFSLIFGVARIVNIAHTAFYMLAAYCIYYGTQKFGPVHVRVHRYRDFDGTHLLPAFYRSDTRT
jgi:branched-subunit amino acid ABC-type transport system permease component